jgi:serine protease Do
MQVAADLAVLHAGIHAEATMPHSLPVRLEGWDPQVGEHVLAVGYPLLDSQRIDAAELRSLLREGMFAGYGRVTKVYPHGRDLANPTPAFEVEADWPSGMSGGPVFNCQGEVVGVVSRGLSPDEQSPGCAWAACLPWISMPAGFLPTLDPANPGWRRGIAAVHTVSGQLVGIFESTEEARRFRNNAVTFSACSHRIGSTDFVLES